MNLFPQIDLNALAPIAGLAAIAVVCIGALLVHSLIRSRIALLIAIVAGVALAGPALLAALIGIVYALIPLALVLAGAALGLIFLLGRNPDLISLARDLMPRPAPPELPEPPETLVISPAQRPGLAAPRPAAPKQKITIIDGDRWGF